MKYAINERIRFDMAISRAKWLFNHERRIAHRDFKNAMRKAMLWGKQIPKRKHKKFLI